MSSPAEISICTRQDYDQILDDLREFWGARDTRHLHHPFLIYEFGNSAFVIRNGGEVVAYLFGFLSQTEPVGYVHAVAVRTSARRQRLAQELFGHFAEFARRHGCKHVKAITTPSNLESIAFHKSLGMQLLGEPNSDGTVTGIGGGRLHLVVGLRPCVSLLTSRADWLGSGVGRTLRPRRGPHGPGGPG